MVCIPKGSAAEPSPRKFAAKLVLITGSEFSIAYSEYISLNNGFVIFAKYAVTPAESSTFIIPFHRHILPARVMHRFTASVHPDTISRLIWESLPLSAPNINPVMVRKEKTLPSKLSPHKQITISVILIWENNRKYAYNAVFILTYNNHYDIIVQPIAQRRCDSLSNVTIYTLAKELNMTTSMVSRAFNPDGRISEEKRKLVMEAAKKYDFSPNRFASRLSMKTVHIGILVNSRFDAGTEQIIKGFKTAYENLKDYKVKYEINVINPVANSFEDYVRILSKYKSFDGIIVTGMSSSKYSQLLCDVSTVNPNIVQVQSVNNDTDYLFCSKHDERVASYLAAEFLYNCLKKSNRRNVILFTGEQESTLHSSAQKFFIEACKEFELNLLECIDMKDSDEYLADIVPGVFEKYADYVDGIYITSGISGSLAEYLDDRNINIPFVGFDTYGNIRHYIENGIVSAAISQNMANQAETAFELLVRHLISGENIPKTVFADVQIVLKSNLHQY